MRERIGHIFCILGALLFVLSLATFHSDHTGSLLFILSSGACSLTSLIMLGDASIEEEEEDLNGRG